MALPTGWISVSTERLFVTMNVLSPLFPLPGIGLGGVTAKVVIKCLSQWFLCFVLFFLNLGERSMKTTSSSF